MITFDTHNWLAARVMNKKLTHGRGGTLLRWAIDDSSELERANRKMRRTDAVSALSAPSSAASRGMRILAALTRPIPVMRDLALYLRYEFDNANNTTSRPNPRNRT